MSDQFSVALLQAAARQAGADDLALDALGCRFRLRGHGFSLSLCEGPVGPYVVGEMQLPSVRPEQDARQILLAMYLNASLSKTAHFPIWYAVDPEVDRLCLMFSLNAREITVDGLAQVLNGMAVMSLT